MNLETILLVYNDACIRTVVRAVLQQFGYEVLEAGSDAQAMNVALTPKITIDLLLTDMGAESASHLKEVRPDMKVLCISSGLRGMADARVQEQRYTIVEKPLRPHRLARIIREVLDKPQDAGRTRSTGLLQDRLKNLNPAHPYFARHGITSETVQHFGAGFFAGPGKLAGRIVVPIHSEEGKVVAYAGYSVDGAEPRCQYWPDFNKSHVLFNYNSPRCLITEFAISVVVVDELLDCMKVHQAGFPSVVSLIGPSFSEAQERLLTENFYLIVLLLNGSDITRRIATRLMKTSFVRVLADAGGRLPHDLSPDEIGRLMCAVTEYSRTENRNNLVHSL